MIAAGLVAGVFVGGASRRMGGRPKGLLLAPPAPGRPTRVTVLERTVALAREQCAEVVLIGRAEAYAALGIPAIEDVDAASGGPGGPLAGLLALLEYAAGRTAVALACDMPYLTREMLARLATFQPEAAAVAPKERGEGEVWSPFFARYDASRVAEVVRQKIEAGERSLRAILDAVGAEELPLSPAERSALRDWDTPEDLDSHSQAR